MPSVNTVLGPIDAGDLGITLMHEHLVVRIPGWHQVHPTGYEPEERARLLTEVTEMLTEVRAEGVRTVVDPTPIDLDRDIEFMQEASAKSGVQIVCATGLYHQQIGLPSYWRTRSAGQMTEEFVREYEKGIGASGVRPGIIKAASSANRIQRHEDKVLRAAARAHKQTGLPITTHTDHATMGPEQLEIFLEEGAEPARVVIGHSCGNSDLGYQQKILGRGANVGFDRIGLHHHTPDAFRLATLVSLLGLGYAGQIVLSQDHTPCFIGRGVSHIPPESAWRRAHGYMWLFQDFLPKLRAAGVAQSVIDQMLIDNPRRILGGAP